jgi:hypothetical protein
MNLPMTKGAGSAFLDQDLSHLVQELLVLKDLPHDVGMRFSIEDAIRETTLTHQRPTSCSPSAYIISDKKYRWKTNLPRKTFLSSPRDRKEST